jgi:amino acid adenylation domain-containing protein
MPGMEIQDIYRLSPLQEGILFHSLYDKDSTAYFQQVSYRIRDDLDMSLIRQSLGALMERYDVLRTAFVYESIEKPRQVVLRRRPVQFDFTDLRAVKEKSEAERILLDHKARDMETGFDLSEDVLIRLVVYQMGDAEYVFIWSYHHIIMDGWCIGILVSDFREIYESLRGHRQVDLPLVTAYGKYIAWIYRQDIAASRQFWENYLSGYSVHAGIPRKELSGKARVYDGREMDILFDRETTAGLVSLAGRCKATLSTLVQTIWGLLLSKYNDCRDVVFGIVVSGRPAEIEQVESVVGLFINAIPVRINYDTGTGFSEFLRQVQQRAAKSESHHHYPLAEIQALSELKQDLLDHILIFENYPVVQKIGESDAGAGILSSVELHSRSHYDLAVNFFPGEELLMKIVFNMVYYEEETIKRIRDYFGFFVKQILEDENKAIGDLRLLLPGEEDALQSFNGDLANFPLDTGILQHLRHSVGRFPHCVALVYEDRTLTYGQVDRTTDHIADVLRRRHAILPSDIVAFQVERSEKMILLIWGILKAGAIFLPIDRHSPLPRTRFIVNDSQAKLIVTEEGALTDFGNTVPIDGLFRETNNADHVNVADTTGPDSPAYVIYTSGTTGNPKGVLVSHRSVVNYTFWFNTAFHLTPKDRGVIIASLAYDSQYTSFWASVFSGGALHILKERPVLEPGELVSVLMDSQATYLKLMPSHLKMILSDPGIGQKIGKLALRVIICGGEEFNASDVGKYYSFRKDILFVNHYGPTETTIGSVAIPVPPDRLAGFSAKPVIGRPINNTGICILNKDKQLLPVGIAGDIYISGAGLALGYLNRPDLTDRVFTDNPCKPGEKAYFTGDTGRWLPDGTIQFLGRKDSQIKIRGYRIELKEISDALLKHDRLRDCLVIAQKDADGTMEIVAYFITSGEVSVKALREHLHSLLPGYMIPAHFIQLDAFPVQSNGKINRKELPAPQTGKALLSDSMEDETEKKLLGIWSEVLGQGEHFIYRDSNFFELGGHSLNLMSLLARIQAIFGRDLSVSAVFDSPTIESQAKILRQATGRNGYPMIHPALPKEYYALSSAQKRIFIQQHIEGDVTTYNMPYIFELKDGLDIVRLEKAFRLLIDRHESFRTSFHLKAGEPCQVIHDQIDFCLQTIQGGSTYMEEMIDRFIRPFDLGMAPLIRAGVLKNNSGETFLIVDIHHIISDGISSRIILNDFMDLYQIRPLLDLRIQYKDYAEWEKSPDVLKMLKKQEAYWMRQFEGPVPLLYLPWDFDPGHAQQFEGERLINMISESDSRQLRTMALRENVTSFMIFLGLYGIMLSKISGQNDFVIGIPVSGRRVQELEPVVGVFVNMLALRVRLSRHLTFRQYIKTIKELCLNAFDNQEYQFDELVERLGIRQNEMFNPLFDVIFSFNKDVSAPAAEGTDNITARMYPYNRKHFSKYHLSLECTEGEDSTALTLEYRTELFKHSTIVGFNDHLTARVKMVLAGEDAIIGEMIGPEVSGERRLTESDLNSFSF